MERATVDRYEECGGATRTGWSPLDGRPAGRPMTCRPALAARGVCWHGPTQPGGGGGRAWRPPGAPCQVPRGRLPCRRTPCPWRCSSSPPPEGAVYLMAHLGRCQEVANEDGAHRPAPPLQHGVGRVLQPTPGEGSAHLLLAASAVPSRSAVAYLTSWSYWRAISSQAMVFPVDGTARQTGEICSRGVPVDHHAPPAVADVVLGHEVRRPRAKLL